MGCESSSIYSSRYIVSSPRSQIHRTAAEHEDRPPSRECGTSRSVHQQHDSQLNLSLKEQRPNRRKQFASGASSKQQGPRTTVFKSVLSDHEREMAAVSRPRRWSRGASHFEDAVDIDAPTTHISCPVQRGPLRRLCEVSSKHFGANAFAARSPTNSRRKSIDTSSGEEASTLLLSPYCAHSEKTSQASTFFIDTPRSTNVSFGPMHEIIATTPVSQQQRHRPFLNVAFPHSDREFFGSHESHVFFGERHSIHSPHDVVITVPALETAFHPMIPTLALEEQKDPISLLQGAGHTNMYTTSCDEQVKKNISDGSSTSHNDRDGCSRDSLPHVGLFSPPPQPRKTIGEGPQ